MTHLTRFVLLVIIPLQQTYAKEFTPIRENVIALHEVEEWLLPKLDTFIGNKENHLKELERMINQTAAVKTMQASDGVEGYLGSPLNQYFLIKRFIDDWGTLRDLLDSDSSTNGEFVFVFTHNSKRQKNCGHMVSHKLKNCRHT